MCIVFVTILVAICQSILLNNNNESTRQCVNNGNIAIISMNGRVGSSNLLEMLGSSNFINVGEIFMHRRFTSLNLPPNINSPKQFPAEENHKTKMIKYIEKSFQPQSNRPNKYYSKRNIIASIKFWHAWMNGVSIGWLVEQVLVHGCVQNVVLISRNPIRIVISEQYAHKIEKWKFDKNDIKPDCTQLKLSFHVGAQWTSEMAIRQYLGFREILSLKSIASSNSSSSVNYVGLSYENDILLNPEKALKIILRTFDSTLVDKLHPQSSHAKGITCKLSDLLINYEELICSFKKFYRENSYTIESYLLSYPTDLLFLNNIMNSESSESQQIATMKMSYSSNMFLVDWMTFDDDNSNMSFIDTMHSWSILHHIFGSHKHMTECSLDEILLSNLEFSNRFSTLSNKKDGYGMCGVGGETKTCKNVGVANNNEYLCANALTRLDCDFMTYKNQECYLHKAINDFRLEQCDGMNYNIKKLST
jgi:hypothetical protein